MKFKDPYADTPDELSSRLSAWVPETDKVFLMGIRPHRGTVQTTINILLKGLIDECKQRGITSYDNKAAFEALVCERAAPRGTSGSATTERDERTAIKGLHNPSAQQQDVGAITKGRTRPRTDGSKKQPRAEV